MADTATLTAFLFTDIEGSSLKWLNRRAAMQEALTAHDRILRAAIADYAGKVFKTAGDAFFAAFKRPSDAANAAIAAQKALAAQDWSAVDGLKVRMAVHCGTAEQREGDWYGPALNRCARLLVLGHGGQILVSSATAELLASEREVKDPMRQVGTHPLDDPAQPVGIHQVFVAGLPQDFPPLRAPETRPTNLPRHLTPLIGREEDLQTVKDLVAANRLVTLTGPGGVGKTRLAIEVGAQLLSRFEHGVWLVELAPLTDPDLVPAAVANALGVQLSPNLTAVQSLHCNLNDRRVLIILDNCEHVVTAAAELVEALLSATPGVRIVASSQELIGLPGEHVFRVASLSVPASTAPTLEEALGASAIQLFEARSKAVDPKFAVDNKNASTVAAICRRLDGVALAIEMAAARVSSLGLDAVARGLDDRFRLLTGGKRTALPRQRTLHAALDWSHALLSENDRTVFRRLGQFAGGFTLDAAASVASGGSLQPHEVVDCLSDLVAKSLVVADTKEERTRYRLLETARAYALEKLGEAGENEEIARRHAGFYADHLGAYLVQQITLPTAIWRARNLPEVDNLRAALATSFGPAGDSQAGILLAVKGAPIWVDLSLFNEERRFLDLAVERLSTATPPLIEAQLWLAVGLSQSQGGVAPTPESIAAMDRAAQMFRRLDDHFYLQRSLVVLAHACAMSGNVTRAREVLVEAKALVDTSRNERELGWYSCALGITEALSGKFSESHVATSAAVQLGRVHADANLENWAGMWLVIATWRLGRRDEALELALGVLNRIRAETAVLDRHLMFVLGLLKDIETEKGDHGKANEWAREWFTVARRFVPVHRIMPLVACDIARKGRIAEAARLLGWQRHVSPTRVEHAILIQMRKAELDVILAQALSPAEIERLMVEGAQLSEDDVCRLAVQP